LPQTTPPDFAIPIGVLLKGRLRAHGRRADDARAFVVAVGDGARAERRARRTAVAEIAAVESGAGSRTPGPARSRRARSAARRGAATTTTARGAATSTVAAVPARAATAARARGRTGVAASTILVRAGVRAAGGEQRERADQQECPRDDRAVRLHDARARATTGPRPRQRH